MRCHNKFTRAVISGLVVALLVAVVASVPDASAQSDVPFRYCSSELHPLRIDQTVATNGRLRVDGDGEASDFIVIRNTEFDPIDLDLWQISDGTRRWVIPVGFVVPGKSSVTIWASGKGNLVDPDFPGPPDEMHTNFRLAPAGEEITLAEPSSCIADRLTYPALQRDEIYGYDFQGQLGILEPEAIPVVCAERGSIVITQVQLNNQSTRADEDGEFGDWIELQNASAEAVDLSRWLLSDGSDEGWRFPADVTLAADETVLVWADGKNRGASDEELHANFSLANSGETVSISSSPECVVDDVVVPEIFPDAVWTRTTGGEFEAVGGEAPQAPRTDVCVAVNELMTQNVSTRQTARGQYKSWIELANFGEDAVDLADWRLRGAAQIWVFPEGVLIEPGELLLVWAGDGAGVDTGSVVHADFVLDPDGGPLDLVSADGEEIALTTYPVLADDESFGISEGGDSVIFEAGKATPGRGPIVNEECTIRRRVDDADAAAVSTDPATVVAIDEADEVIAVVVAREPDARVGGPR